MLWPAGDCYYKRNMVYFDLAAAKQKSIAYDYFLSNIRINQEVLVQMANAPYVQMCLTIIA